jgi:O-antigen ligase
MPWMDHHANRTAVLFALLPAFTVPALLATKRRGDALLALVTVLAAVGGVLATQSRTGLVVLAAGALAFVLVRQRQRARGGARLLVAVAAAAPLVVSVYGMLPRNRALSLGDENFQSRQQIWSNVWETFASAPVLGHGLNYAGGSAHNEYLAQLVDGGLVGGAILLAVLLTFAVMAWSVSRRGGLDGGIALGVLTYLAVFAVSMTVATTWRTAAPAILSWLCFGILAAVAARPSPEAIDEPAMTKHRPEIGARNATPTTRRNGPRT